MELKDYLLNNTLTIDEDCYYDFDKYTYKGTNEEGKHILSKLQDENNIEIQIIKTPFVPQLPIGLYFQSKRTRQFAELVKYVQMLGDIYYELKIYDDVFKGYAHESYFDLLKNWNVIDNPFKDDEEIYSEVESIENEIRIHEKKIQDIKDQFINPLLNKRKKVYLQCKHDWYKYEEDEVSKGRFEQTCVCDKCGEEKINRYSKLY